jgi:hypothetical protein
MRTKGSRQAFFNSWAPIIDVGQNQVSHAQHRGGCNEIEQQ